MSTRKPARRWVISYDRTNHEGGVDHIVEATPFPNYREAVERMALLRTVTGTIYSTLRATRWGEHQRSKE